MNIQLNKRKSEYKNKSNELTEAENFKYHIKWLQKLLENLNVTSKRETLRILLWLLQHIDNDNNIYVSHIKLLRETHVRGICVREYFETLCEDVYEDSPAFLIDEGNGRYRVNPKIIQISNNERCRLQPNVSNFDRHMSWLNLIKNSLDNTLDFTFLIIICILSNLNNENELCISNGDIATSCKTTRETVRKTLQLLQYITDDRQPFLITDSKNKRVGKRYYVSSDIIKKLHEIDYMDTNQISLDESVDITSVITASEESQTNKENLIKELANITIGIRTEGNTETTSFINHILWFHQIYDSLSLILTPKFKYFAYVLFNLDDNLKFYKPLENELDDSGITFGMLIKRLRLYSMNDGVSQPMLLRKYREKVYTLNPDVVKLSLKDIDLDDLSFQAHIRWLCQLFSLYLENKNIESERSNRKRCQVILYILQNIDKNNSLHIKITKTSREMELADTTIRRIVYNLTERTIANRPFLIKSTCSVFQVNPEIINQS